MRVTINNYKEFVESTFKSTLDDYFQSLDHNPIEIWHFMKDLALEWEDQGYKFTCDLAVRERVHSLYWAGGWFLIESERSEGPFVMYEFFADGKFIDLLRNGKIEFIYRMDFACPNRLNYVKDFFDDRVFLKFAKPYLTRLLKHYPILGLSEDITDFRRDRAISHIYDIVSKIKWE